LSLPKPPPPTLGRYEVGPKIGGGGMADVYVGRGVSDRGLEELVALKVMHQKFGRDPNFLRMFSDEAKILARFSHPNIVRTIESGITSEYRFIAMDLLSGRTLMDVWEALVARGERLSFRHGAWICARVADALHAAHELRDQRGQPLSVVHRDVNPSNIFLTYEGVPKLIDFGLVKARDRRTKSAEGVIKGKFAYLAPEQLSEFPVDRRIDLYALGATLWEVGTMRRLFRRETDIDTLRAIHEGNVPDPRGIVDDYPDELRAVLLHALARNPEERYATADLMRDDLDAFVDDAAGEMTAEVAALVARLFPGEEQRHLAWQREAVAVRVLATVAPPPSNQMQDGDEIIP
jgi:eukaryotic-like serine/threonine-protein kinase